MALIARGEFSLIIIGLVGASISTVAALATSYVFVMAIAGPVLARLAGGPAAERRIAKLDALTRCAGRPPAIAARYRMGLFHAAGDGVDPVPAAVGAENLGRAVRVLGRPDRLKPHPAQHRGALGSAPSRLRACRPRAPSRPGRAASRGAQLGRRTAAVDDFQHSAQCGVGENCRLPHRRRHEPAWPARASRQSGAPGRPPGRRGVRDAFRRNAACDDCPHWGTLRVGGSYSTTGTRRRRRGGVGSHQG